MIAKDAKIDYDYDDDILYLYTGEKVKDSLQIENFVICSSGDDEEDAEQNVGCLIAAFAKYCI